MPAVGYAHLIDAFGLQCLRPPATARVEPVTRILRRGDKLLVPPNVAPGRDARPIEHVLFALRHEGVDVAIVDALAHAGVITDADVREAIVATPAGGYTRRLGYLWELVTGREIQDVAPQGNYLDLYDPTVYYTSDKTIRDTKWRVDFNGLGVRGYCPVVRRTTELAQLLERDLFSEVQEFAEQARKEGLLDRILAWAYLDETRSSFEIEHEEPPADKAEAFAALLRNAHDARPIDEQYLVELQNLAITNPPGREPGYRNNQNWLGRGGHGAAAVRYLPPPPDVLDDLMDKLAGICNAPRAKEPLLHAALCSFGFVYVHPFMDGNGRLSRFLFHHALCMTKALPNGLILPVSTAMHHDEGGYLQALEAFSREARQLWGVRWIQGGDFQFEQRCRNSVYRYWDATAQAAYSARTAALAMDVHLMGEARFLSSFDAAYKALDRSIDLPSPLLHKLIHMCQTHGGTISKHRRKQFKDAVPPEYFDEIEMVVAGAFGFPAPHGEGGDDGGPPAR